MVSRRAAVRAALSALVTGSVLAAPAIATAQPVPFRQYEQEPTAGLHLPATPLAGEHDARAVSVNPAGLHFLRGPHLTLLWDAADEDLPSPASAGYGGFLAGAFGGGFLPRLAVGIGVEILRPAQAHLLPDPGSQTRFTWAQSIGIGRNGSLGASWHRFVDHGPMDGFNTFDVGLSWRLGNRIAIGGVIRDVTSPDLDGAVVQRRYELEVGARPLGTDRLDLGVGARLGGDDDNLDGWLRASLQITRGIYLHATAESRALRILETVGAERNVIDERELQLTAGLELSLGAVGISGYGRGVVDDSGDGHAAGTTLVARISSEQVPSVYGRRNRIERIDLAGGVSSRDLAGLVVRLRAIERDPSVKALVVTLDGISAGWATLEELRTAVRRVRAAGKKVFAYMVTGSGRDYWVATAADKIYVDPAGGIRLAGFAGTTMYYKGAFDMLGVNAQFEKIAEYKSAPEAYTEVGPSEPALRMRNELFDSIWDEFVNGIAEARKLDRAAVVELIDDGPFTAGDLAADQRLVDAVADPDKVAELVAKELGRLYPVSRAPDERPSQWNPPAVAVIYAEGDIVDGKSMDVPLLGRRLVGGETLANAIASARDNPSIKAIVLRIDSPGGSALASELMAREVFKTRGVKPILCSMGDVAASGGYFLAAGCDVILADSTTITGSIGIFYGKFDLSALLAKVGVSVETFRRGQRADMESYFRPYTEEERTRVRDGIRYFYGRFTSAVAEGRGMTQAAVDAVGRGRVWSGVQAKDVGLIDRFGGLADALQLAKERIGLDPDDTIRLISMPSASGGLLQLILGSVVGAQAPGFRLRDLPGGAAIADAIPPSVWVQPDAAQARLPFTIQWH
jgi:protease-4